MPELPVLRLKEVMLSYPCGQALAGTGNGLLCCTQERECLHQRQDLAILAFFSVYQTVPLFAENSKNLAQAQVQERVFGLHHKK